MAQRLVRKLCTRCSTRRRTSDAEKVLLEKYGLPIAEVPEPVGCDACSGTGYHGRLAISEIYAADSTVEHLISEGAGETAIARELEGRGFRTLLAEGFARVVDGVTTIEEIQKVAVT